MAFRNIETLEKSITTKLYQFSRLSEKISYLFYSHENELKEKIQSYNNEVRNSKKNLKLGKDFINKITKITDIDELFHFRENNEYKYSKQFEYFDLLIELNWNKQDFKYTKEVYPNLATTALLTIQYSIIEDSLKKICDFYKSKNKFKISVNDLSGVSILDTYKKYFLKVLCFNFQFGKSTQWKKIRDIQKVRNKIIHNGGYIDDLNNNSNLMDIITKYDNIHIDKDNTIRIDELFLYDFSKDCILFFESLFKYLKENT